MKNVQIRSFFWSEFGKIRNRKDSVFGHFSRSETHFRCGSVSEFAFDNQITIATFLLQALFSRNLAMES